MPTPLRITAATAAPIPVNGRTRVFMVVGDPVVQVQAPQIFNRVFQRHGVDAVLVPVQVAAADLPAFARAVLRVGEACDDGQDGRPDARSDGLPGAPVGGLWLTIPHKTTLVPQLAGMDAAARLAQSVNAVRRGADGGLHGGLFDGSGLVGALRHFGIDTRGARVLLVGTGGAGAAIAAALRAEPLAELALHDLGSRAADLARRLDDPRVRTPGTADPAGFDLVIHATPLGLRADDPLPFDVARLSPHARVVDILMKRELTPLLRACAQRGITAHSGFEMLVQQVPDYLRFFGLDEVAAAVRDDLQDVREHLGAR